MRFGRYFSKLWIEFASIFTNIKSLTGSFLARYLPSIIRGQRDAIYN